MGKLKYALGACIAGYLATVYIVDQFDQQLSEKRVAQAVEDQSNALSQQAFAIMNRSGCSYCHTTDSEMPFYGELPVAKQMMEYDIERGLRHFNIEAMMEQVRAGDLVSEVELAKLESVLDENAMPPAMYLTMHWRSKLSDEETATLRDWVKQERVRHHPDAPTADTFKYEAVQPINSEFVVDLKKVVLGDKLYHDVRLSGDNTVSCASCHSLATGGVDRLDTSTGVGGAKGPINAPTVYNAVFNVHQFWDGRATDLQEQAGGPPMNPIEMASTSWQQIIGKLAEDPVIVEGFAEIYPDGITGNNITDAIAEFEKTLVTPNSRFDKFLKGDVAALTAEEQEGYALFKEHKCATCHAGEAMGGLSFEVMGLKKDYFGDRGNMTDVDNGRFNVTKDPRDMHRFKVPTLRNVALTAPYFHDASAKTLEEAVDQMALYQVGVKLSQDEINKITAYLHTLNGEYKGQVLQ